MVSGFISRLVILIFGTLYPAYASYKAVRTKNVKEYVKWMMYWIVFALFTCAETFTDLFLSFWFPFYYEIKIITVIYLLSPATKGSSILYRKFVHPVLTKKEQEIDEYIAKAKEQGYHTMLNLGSKGVNYATSLIMQTAIKGLPNLPLTPSSDFLPAKSPDLVDIFDMEDECNSIKDLSENCLGQGGGGLVNQLRKSYSLSDLSNDQNETVTDGEGPRRIRRNPVNKAGRAYGNYNGFYPPEVNTYEQAFDANRESPFPDDLSSGYSSGDPLYYEPRRPKGDVLVRTASLGPSSRIRTRAVTRNGLPKRASLSEDGPTWSALESHEGQNETDIINFPLSHSASFSFPITSLNPYFFPEYSYILKNQAFTFLSQSQYPQFLNNNAVTIQNDFGGVTVCESNKNSNNNSIIISEENSSDSVVANTESDVSNLVSETVIDDCSVNLTSENIKKEEEITKDEIINEDKLKEKKIENQNSNSSSLNSKEKLVQERCGKYNKKPAPTPPAEESVSKSSSLTLEDEEAEFFTPTPSPKLSRKQSTSDSNIAADKSSASRGPQLTASVVEPKKGKTKKGDFNISKKWHLPKMPFTFWHHKGGKQTSNSETSSVASVETASTKLKTESEESLFVPLKDKNDQSDATRI